MRRKLPTILLLIAALAALGLLAGCNDDEGEGETIEAIEGEPVELGDLLYNVQITRFLNPGSPEDSNYLDDVEPPPVGMDYLAVFLRIQNEGDGEERIPDSFPIVDTRGNSFEPVETENPFALELGAEIPPGGRIPAPDTPAASGTIKGSMLLYLIDPAVTENRPLKLEIEGPDGEQAEVELDL